MAPDSTPDEVLASHTLAMGSELGPFYNNLQNEVAWLHAKWLEYRKLFAHSPERIDLLNETASFLFGVVQEVMWEDILLSIARLTDPPKSAGKDNLTITRLPLLVTDSALASRAKALIDIARSRCEFARAWRHRRLAHRDLALAMGAAHTDPLPPSSRKAVADALESLRDLLNLFEEHFIGGRMDFEHVRTIEDGESLIQTLALASQRRARREARLESGNVLPEDLEPAPAI